MSTRKAFVHSTLIAAGIFGSAGASAFDYVEGGSLNGTTTAAGPVTFLCGGVIVMPCNAALTIVGSGGSASVTAASFSGSAACSAIASLNLPWSMGKPLGALGVANNAKIPMKVHLPVPVNQTMSGTLAGTLSPGGSLTLTGTLTASPATMTCTVNSRAPLTTSPVLSII